jgi:hypothetical protein
MRFAFSFFFSLQSLAFQANSNVLHVQKGGQRVSKLCMLLSSLCILSIVTLSIVCAAQALEWLYFFYYLSGVKLTITFLKYCPQVRREHPAKQSFERKISSFTGVLELETKVNNWMEHLDRLVGDDYFLLLLLLLLC